MLVFQTEVYAIVACVHEIENQDRPEKYVHVCSDGQEALQALQAAKKVPIGATVPEDVE
jgi:hypothetical protein